MRERAQASVETIALTAAALALAAALLLGVVRLAPALATTLGQAFSAVFDTGVPRAPGLDSYEHLLLDGATSPADDGPTLLDLQTRLRSRLAPAAADAAFAAAVRPLVDRALATRSIDARIARIEIVDRATEDAWLQERFHPGRLERLAHVAVGLAGTPGAIVSLAEDMGLTEAEPVDAIEPGHAAGDVVVQVGDGLQRVFLRRRAGSGLAVIAQSLPRGRVGPR